VKRSVAERSEASERERVAGVVGVSSDSSQSAPSSRLSKTNRADHENRTHGPSTAESLNRPLTERDGVSLRAEVIDEDREGFQPVSWREAVWRWRNWYEDTSDSQAVFENLEGERVKGSDPNRFHPDYGDKQYAKLKDLERGVREDYGRRLHTAIVTLTASSAPSENDSKPLAPVDHLDELLSSWDAVRRALDRSLEGRRYERLAILEPHKSGYVHVHLAVFVEGTVTRRDFAPVVEAHLRNCSLAAEDAHDVEDDSTISIRWAGGDRDDELDDEDHLDQLAIYLAEYLGTYGEDPLDQDQHIQMANAVLWATERQRWRPSNGAQEYMATERSDPSPEWELVGIEDYKGELHEASGGFGGVTKLETFTPGRPRGLTRGKDGPPVGDG